MGLYDTVEVRDPRFVCSEGHDLGYEEFQTKDLGCTMGWSAITSNGDPSQTRLTVHSGGWGDQPRLPYLGCMYICCSCSRCPAFVQAGTGNFCPTGVEFEVEVVDNIVRAIKRVSESTADYLEN